jgi:hypothetical protein
MTGPDRQVSEGTSELLAAVGVTATPEGKARARKRLAEAERRWTDEQWAALRDQVGVTNQAA